MKLSGFIAMCVLLAMPSTSFALSLKLQNHTKWEIHELYFSPAHEKEWGPDQLEDEVIAPGEEFTLTKIAKGGYDVKIVDEDGDSCEVGGVDFSASEVFALTDQLLLGCQAATEEAKEGDDEE